MKTFFIVIFSVFALAVLFFMIKSHKLFRTLIFNAFLGLCVLAIIDLTSKLTGLYIPINWYSVGGTAIFGIPAVCLFLVLQILI
ncbi:MAG: pro-sigmaK processing inhibitor BofA family protein [Clostridia bacterium]|nr:pro-sigmaK processing inhibitor BofA family protein [Clostridia bacterium]